MKKFFFYTVLLTWWASSSYGSSLQKASSVHKTENISEVTKGCQASLGQSLEEPETGGDTGNGASRARKASGQSEPRIERTSDSETYNGATDNKDNKTIDTKKNMTNAKGAMTSTKEDASKAMTDAKKDVDKAMTSTKEDASKAMTDAKKDVDKAMTSTKEDASKAMTDAKEDASKAMTSTEKAMDNAVSTVKKAAADAVSTVKEAAGSAASSMKETIMPSSNNSSLTLDQKIQELNKDYKIVLWVRSNCRYCAEFKPVFQNFAKIHNLKENTDYEILDIQRNNFADAEEMKVVPTVVLVRKDGQGKEKVTVGLVSLQKLEQEIEKKWQQLKNNKN